MPKLSIVVPCYNEEETIPLFYPAVEKVVKRMPVDTEYWFVNDGSSDGTLAELRKLHAQDPERVHYVSFSRNLPQTTITPTKRIRQYTITNHSPAHLLSN